MNNDMNDMMKKFSEMINSNQIPDNVKNMLNNFSSNNSNSVQNNSYNENTANNFDQNINSTKNNISNFNQNIHSSKNNNSNFNHDIHSSKNNNSNFNQDNENNRNSNQNSSTNNIFENIDINTIFKIQNVMNSLNNKENDSRTNLLLSLKPYLKDSRKNKVDQYIQLMKVGKVFEIMNPLGGDKNV